MQKRIDAARVAPVLMEPMIALAQRVAEAFSPELIDRSTPASAVVIP